MLVCQLRQNFPHQDVSFIIAFSPSLAERILNTNEYRLKDMCKQFFKFIVAKQV